MPTHQHLRYFEDTAQVPLGELVQLDVPAIGQKTFAISCRADTTSVFAALSDNFVAHNVVGPVVAEFGGSCVSFGNNYTIGFDPHSMVIGGQQQVGNLVVTRNGLFLRAHRMPSMTHHGGPCSINLSTGAIVGAQSGATIATWSLSVDAWNNAKPVVVFKRPAEQPE